MTTTSVPPISRALDALEGLSVGDAFGECFYHRPTTEMERQIADRQLPTAPWRWTDDTAMATSVVIILGRHGGIERDELAARFGVIYRSDPTRGYGPGMRRLLPRYRSGREWRELARQQFGGGGSHGNGGAMRVAPVGAFYAGDPEEAARQAAASAEVTHAHPEGIAGAVAVAAAAAYATTERALTAQGLMEAVCDMTPTSKVRDRVMEALNLALQTDARAAARTLGSGQKLSAQDTVPYCLWCVARCPDDYEMALWLTVEGLGDRDTTCAIVGGILGGRVGASGIPATWRQARGRLPTAVTELRPS